MISLDTRKLISDNRTFLMGISILWIILHHIQFFGIYDFGLFDYVVRVGNIGVDIFLFLSSFGLYYSFSKNTSLSGFYFKRLFRVLPTFLLVTILYYVIKGNPIAIIYYKTWYWAFYSNWFITFILIMYIVFPYVYKLQKRYLYMPLILSIIISVFLTVFLVYTNRNDIHDVPMLMAQRIPIFVAGMLYADERISLRCNYKMFLVLLLPIITLILYNKLDNILYPSYFL